MGVLPSGLPVPPSPLSLLEAGVPPSGLAFPASPRALAFPAFPPSPPALSAPLLLPHAATKSAPKRVRCWIRRTFGFIVTPVGPLTAAARSWRLRQRGLDDRSRKNVRRD